MPEAIVYCDKCSRMIPRSEIVADEAIVSEGFAICATCAGALTPEQRRVLTRRGRSAEGADGGLPGRLRGQTAAMKAAADAIEKKKKTRGGTNVMRAADVTEKRRKRGGTNVMRAAEITEKRRKRGGTNVIRAVTPHGVRQSGERAAVGRRARQSDRLTAQAPPKTTGWLAVVLVILVVGAIVGAIVGGLVIRRPSPKGRPARPPVAPVELEPPSRPVTRPVARPDRPPAPSRTPPPPRTATAGAAAEKLARIHELIDPLLLEHVRVTEALGAFPDEFPGTPEAEAARRLLDEVEEKHATIADDRLRTVLATAEQHVALGRYEQAVSLLSYTGARFAGSRWYKTRGEAAIAAAIEDIERKRAKVEEEAAKRVEALRRGLTAPPPTVLFDVDFDDLPTDAPPAVRAVAPGKAGDTPSGIAVSRTETATVRGSVGGLKNRPVELTSDDNATRKPQLTFTFSQPVIEGEVRASWDSLVAAYTPPARAERPATVKETALTFRFSDAEDKPFFGVTYAVSSEDGTGGGIDVGWQEGDVGWSQAAQDERRWTVGGEPDRFEVTIDVDAASATVSRNGRTLAEKVPLSKTQLALGVKGFEITDGWAAGGGDGKFTAGVDNVRIVSKVSHLAGLLGQYFNGREPGPGNFVLCRLDPNIDFDWGRGSPAPGVNGDDFSIRWTGELRTPADGTYTFTAAHDDFAAIWVDGEQIAPGAVVSTSGSVELKRGWVPFKFEFVEFHGDARVKLRWEGPGFGKTTLAREFLRTAAAEPEAAAPEAAADLGPAPAEVAKGEVAKGLVGHWKFDESEGTVAADSSGNGTDGKVHYVAEFQATAGRRGGGALYHKGGGWDGNAVDCGTAEVLDVESFTIAVWTRPASISTVNSPGNGIVCKWPYHEEPQGGGWGLRVNADGSVTFALDGMKGLKSAPGVCEAGKWTHVAGTHDEKTGVAELLIDGVTVATETGAMNKPAAGESLTFGRGDKWPHSFHGWMNDARLYDRAMPADEVARAAGVEVAAPAYVSGLLGEYFNNPGFDPANSALRRVESTVDFDWRDGSPAPEVLPDDFSARWTGELRVPSDGRYDFRVIRDNGARLKLGGRLVYDKIDNATADETVGVDLTAGWVPVTIEFVEYAGNAVLSVHWRGPGFEMTPIPSQYLRTPAGQVKPKPVVVLPPGERELRLPGAWGEVEGGSGHTNSGDDGRASGGKVVGWFNKPGLKVSVALHVPREIPDAYVYLRYARGKGENGPLDVRVEAPGGPRTRAAAAGRPRRIELAPTPGWNGYAWATLAVGDVAPGLSRVVLECPTEGGAGNLDVVGLVPGAYHGKWSPPHFATGGKLFEDARIADILSGLAARPGRGRKELLAEASALPADEGYSLDLATLHNLTGVRGGGEVRAKRLAAVGGIAVKSSHFDGLLRDGLQTEDGYRFVRKVGLRGGAAWTPAGHKKFKRHLEREKPEVVRICFGTSNLPRADRDGKKNDLMVRRLKAELAFYVTQATAQGTLPVLFTVPGFANTKDPKRAVIGGYNKMVLELAREMKVPCVDAWRILNADSTKRSEYFGAAGRLKAGGFEAMNARFLRLYRVIERWVLDRELRPDGEARGGAEETQDRASS